MRKLIRQRLDLFLKKHATEELVLDIGSGGSSYARYFPNRLTVDIDPDRKPEVVADAASLPFKDGEYSFILCTEMLEHVLDPEKVMAELRRVLAPGGTLLLTTRFVYPLHDAPHDYWRYTRPNLERLFSAFPSVTIEAEAGPFTSLGILVERFLMQTEVRGGKIMKGMLLIFSRLLTFGDWIILRSYGEIQRTTRVPEILTTGYYVTARG
jgi:SAM-dependent methyltransferase